jgi:hypothetical protein
MKTAQTNVVGYNWLNDGTLQMRHAQASMK